jgi:hypothetical protein
MEIKQKNENTKIYFCHNCQTILNEELQKISLPEKDKNGNTISEYLPIEDKRIEYGRNYFVDTQVYMASKQLEKRDIIAMVGSILLSLITGTVLMMCGLTGGGLVVYGVSVIWGIVALCGIISEKNRRVSGDYHLPIRFYGNDKIFGYTSVQNAEYAEDLPPVHIVEVNRDDILKIELDNKIHCHIVTLKNKVNIGNNKMSNILEIPDIFEHEVFNKMLSK